MGAFSCPTGFGRGGLSTRTLLFAYVSTSPQDLIAQVAAGIVDIAIMYAPQHRTTTANQVS